MSATITEVTAYDRRSRATVALSNTDCAFSYRHSRFKAEPERYVVLRVRFELEDAGSLRAAALRRDGPRPRRRGGDRVPLTATGRRC
ncbi:UDP-N-acetylmuramate dehydrogenase [Streptomyces violaceorubidus]